MSNTESNGDSSSPVDDRNCKHLSSKKQELKQIYADPSVEKEGNHFKQKGDMPIVEEEDKEHRPKVKQSCLNGSRSCVSIFYKVAGILALGISGIHMYCDYHKVDRLALMISGFNMVSYYDSIGVLLPERTLHIDLAFINNGNQYQNVLDARFVFPESVNFPNVYWSMYPP